MESLLGGLLIGGTNVRMVTAIWEDSDDIFKIYNDDSVKTSDIPNETIDHIANFFNQIRVLAIGISCFGPLNLDETS